MAQASYTSHALAGPAFLLFARQDLTTAQATPKEDQPIDDRYVTIIRNVIEQVGRHPEQAAAGLDVLSVAKNLERLADHASNIAENVIFLVTGEIIRHQNDLPQD